VMVVVGTYGGSAAGTAIQRAVGALRNGDPMGWARAIAATSLAVLVWARYQPWERLAYGTRSITLSVWTVPWLGPLFSIVVLVGVIGLVGTLTPLRRSATILLLLVGWLASLYGAVFILLGVLPDVDVAGELSGALIRWERQISAYAGRDIAVVEQESTVGIAAAFGAVVAFVSGCSLMVCSLLVMARTRLQAVEP
jgi:hypothetical protein